MKPADIARARMRGQRVWDSTLTSPAAVVGHLGAMQAQELAVARWSVGQRGLGVDAAAVDAALHPVLRDGRMVGQWRRVARGGDERLELHLPTPPRGPEADALELAVAGYREFAGGDVSVRLAPG